jgi:hypothetical protein
MQTVPPCVHTGTAIIALQNIPNPALAIPHTHHEIGQSILSTWFEFDKTAAANLL